jgi:hypothetical protein
MMTAQGISEMAKADRTVTLILSEDEALILNQLLFTEKWPKDALAADSLDSICVALQNAGVSTDGEV